MTFESSRAVDRVRVFTDRLGRHGNDLAVVPDGPAYDDSGALALAAQTGVSETVFIDDPRTGRVRIYVPRARVPFAGHPLVGVAWYLREAGHDIGTLVTDAGAVRVGTSNSGACILTSAGRGVPWTTTQLVSPAAVERADAAGDGRHDYVWAWLDETAGVVRARAFASLSGTREDEATGSAALQLCAELGRTLRIVQGRGSIIDVRPAGSEYELSGFVRAAG